MRARPGARRALHAELPVFAEGGVRELFLQTAAVRKARPQLYLAARRSPAARTGSLDTSPSTTSPTLMPRVIRKEVGAPAGAARATQLGRDRLPGRRGGGRTSNHGLQRRRRDGLNHEALHEPLVHLLEAVRLALRRSRREPPVERVVRQPMHTPAARTTTMYESIVTLLPSEVKAARGRSAAPRGAARRSCRRDAARGTAAAPQLGGATTCIAAREVEAAGCGPC